MAPTRTRPPRTAGAPERTRRAAWTRAHIRDLKDNLIDERSAEWLYRKLARLDNTPKRSKLLLELADYEKHHAAAWQRLLEQIGATLPRRGRTWDHRLMVAMARIFGVATVLPILHKQEVDGIDKYRRQADEWTDPRAQKIFREVLPDEVSHEVDLLTDIRAIGAAKGRLRSAILGANDGLASNLALVTGVAGGTSATGTVILAGAAGLVAGAFSMAAANYVSTKAEQEVGQSRVRLARQAIEVAPKAKRRQAEASLQAKGLDAKEARAVVRRLAASPDALLDLLVQDEPAAGRVERPGPLAWVTGLAFAGAAFIPLLPFLLLPLNTAVLAAIGLSAVALFAAGLLRALWTLFPFVRSGLEMVAVGLGAAAVTYAVGLMVGGIV